MNSHQENRDHVTDLSATGHIISEWQRKVIFDFN